MIRAEQRKDIDEDLMLASKRIQPIKMYLDFNANLVAEYKHSELRHNDAGLKAVAATHALCRSLVQDYRDELELAHSTPDQHAFNMQNLDSMYRTLLVQQIPLARTIAGSSQPYRSSVLNQNFGGFAEKKPKDGQVNYDRFASRKVQQLETQMMNLMGYDKNETTLMMTSSGVAAYDSIEYFLLYRKMQEPCKVLIVPSMYDEIQDICFRTAPHVTTIVQDEYSPDAILKTVLQEKPKAIFIDPLKNTRDMRMTDTDEVIRRIGENYKEEIHIIIDDTMIPGATSPFAAARAFPHVKIMVCSSCAKFLQMGVDSTMGGFMAFPKEYADDMSDIRLTKGAIFQDVPAWSFPVFEPGDYQMRMRRLSRNAAILGEKIEADSLVSQYFKPAFPGLRSHPDYETGQKFPFLGSVLTLQTSAPEKDPRPKFVSAIETVLETAKEKDVQWSWGEAFGFQSPRISVYFEPSFRVQPFLRISAGDRAIDETEQSADALVSGLRRWIKEHPHDLYPVVQSAPAFAPPMPNLP